MMNLLLGLLSLSLLAVSTLAKSELVIPAWDLQWTGKVGDDLKNLSSINYDSSSWYHIPARSTVVAGLIAAGFYNDDQLFYSKNLQTTVDYFPYYSPWLYRATFPIDSANGKHVFLQTNGIASSADIFINGKQVVDHTVQAGTYGGRTYDVTSFAAANNALLIKAYPTWYNRDFAQGYVDWNPYPPDNGTGVWRDVSIKQTGPLAMGPMRIVNDYKPGAKSVQVMLKATVTNLENSKISGTMEGAISGEGLSKPLTPTQKFSLGPAETKTITLISTISNPRIWWPKQWGDQPLYYASAAVRSAGALSDQIAPTQFGIRHITSALNHWNDTMFTLNGHPFQVRGGGHAPDMFLRWNATTFTAQAQYVLDMGLNTIRLEGKEGQPEMYEIADQMGLMILPGWECCDKWEAWSYNNEVSAPLWNDDDYNTANNSMRHEAAMLQTHPSVLGFLVGSDYWPDNRAAAIYVEALRDYDWPNPIVCSAAMRGFPEILGPSGMKMLGPYDWVPPNYWYYDRLGAAFGFGSELGAGVGTPEIGSLQRFLTEEEMNAMWQHPDQGLYHQNTNSSPFHNRKIYNEALFHRYGKPTNLTDYLLKAQIMDYEATRAEFEGFQAKWNAKHPATGLIYWMLNNAWPGLHWNLFDYYLHPGGSYFGSKVGSRMEHVAYSYDEDSVYLINHSLNCTGPRNIEMEIIDIHGNLLANHSLTVPTHPNTSRNISSLGPIHKDVAFLRLLLTDPSNHNSLLSRNVYWLSQQRDILDWKRSTWFTTRVSTYADFTGLQALQPAHVMVTTTQTTVTLTNRASVPAFFIRLNLVDASGLDVVPVLWEDNYVTLWPGESMALSVSAEGTGSRALQVSGWNVGDQTVKMG